jgi:hypothetical protein
MALAVIIVLYVTVGLLAAAGSIAVSRKIFSAKAEQIFFGLFLIAIAGFYLAFAAYFDNQTASRVEITAVAVFAVLGLLGIRLPFVLILGYILHGFWDLLHEVQAHASVSFGTIAGTEIPLGYGFFCAAYDWCMAVYFYIRRPEWNAAWKGTGKP